MSDVTDLIFDGDKMSLALQFCEGAVSSGLLPRNISRPDQALTIMIKGRELGLQPMEAFAGINVIQGKPELSASLMTSLLIRGGVAIETLEATDKACRLRFSRDVAGREVTIETSFTMEDAQRAGLASGQNWKKYPADMLYARALSRGARRIGADLLGGSYVQGEIPRDTRDVTPQEVHQAQVRNYKPDIIEQKQADGTMKQIYPESQAYSMNTVGEPVPDFAEHNEAQFEQAAKKAPKKKTAKKKAKAKAKKKPEPEMTDEQFKTYAEAKSKANREPTDADFAEMDKQAQMYLDEDGVPF